MKSPTRPSPCSYNSRQGQGCFKLIRCVLCWWSLKHSHFWSSFFIPGFTDSCPIIHFKLTSLIGNQHWSESQQLHFLLCGLLVKKNSPFYTCSPTITFHLRCSLYLCVHFWVDNFLQSRKIDMCTCDFILQWLVPPDEDASSWQLLLLPYFWGDSLKMRLLPLQQLTTICTVLLSCTFCALETFVI